MKNIAYNSHQVSIKWILQSTWVQNRKVSKEILKGKERTGLVTMWSVKKREGGERKNRKTHVGVGGHTIKSKRWGENLQRANEVHRGKINHKIHIPKCCPHIQRSNLLKVSESIPTIPLIHMILLTVDIHSVRGGEADDSQSWDILYFALTQGRKRW